MNINLTLLGQSITFAVFVWFCMRFIWPPLTRALEARRKQIADGLAAAEKGRHELELAEKRALEVLRKAKGEAAGVIAAAEKRAAEIADEAKGQAKAEAERILSAARADIEQEVNRAREQLRRHVAELAVAAAGRILEQEIDGTRHARLVESVVKQL
jgi:F-type H+-transporting ATPase subunit b